MSVVSIVCAVSVVSVVTAIGVALIKVVIQGDSSDTVAKVALRW